MTNKEINRESRRIFEGLLLPNWAFRPQEDQEDYGIDGEIEITTAEDKATGFIFKIQLKGTTAASYDSSGQLVFSDASVERFSYYVFNVAIPVVFAVCDVVSGKCFWARVQGNVRIEAALEEARRKGQQSFTLKFPTTRTLVKSESSADEIIDAVASASSTIALRSLQKLPPDRFATQIAAEPSLEATERKLRLFASIAGTARIREMLRSGDVAGAGKKAMEMLESEAEALGPRIDAGICLVLARQSMLHQTKAPTASMEAARFQLGVASRMLEIVRPPGRDRRLRNFVRVYVRASRMKVHGKIALAFVVSEEAQRKQGATLAGPFTKIQRIEVSNKVVRDFVWLHRLIRQCIKQRQLLGVPLALKEVAEALYPFVHALRFSGQTEMAEAYSEAIWNLVPVAIAVAKKLLSEEDATDVLTTLGIRLVGLGEQSTAGALNALILQYEAALAGEPALPKQAEIIRPMRAIVEQMEKNSTLKEEPTMAEARAYFESQAANLGIDLTDPDDPCAQAVRVGLEDLDPTRVARNCAHIHIRNGSYGVPGEMLGLPSAGSKSVVCLKHGHSIEGFRLDDVYRHFSEAQPWNEEQLCCARCADKTPHPEGWEWSFSYATAQEKRYREAH